MWERVQVQPPTSKSSGFPMILTETETERKTMFEEDKGESPNTGPRRVHQGSRLLGLWGYFLQPVTSQLGICTSGGSLQS